MMTAKVLRLSKSMFFFSSSAWSLQEPFVGSSEGGPTWTAASCVDFWTSPGGVETSCCWPCLIFSFFRSKSNYRFHLYSHQIWQNNVTVIWEQVAIIRLFLRHPSGFAPLLRCCKPLCCWSLGSSFLSCALVLISLLVDIVSSQWVVLPKWTWKMKNRLSNDHL